VPPPASARPHHRALRAQRLRRRSGATQSLRPSPRRALPAGAPGWCGPCC